MSKIFISHSTQDKLAAIRILERLRESGYESLFLDSDPEAGIRPGSDWERSLFRNMKLAAAVVVLCSPESMDSRWCFAEITWAKALGKPLIPLIIRDCKLVGSLADRQAIDMVGREEEGLRCLIDGLRLEGLDASDSFDWDASRPPFPGFSPFDREDAGIYFGRDPEIRQVIETLTGMQRQGEPRLAVIVGSSGSGKSSLVRAGVLPRLAKDPSRWAIVPPFRPMKNPVGELARAVAMAFPQGPGRPDWKALGERIRSEARSEASDCALADAADDLTMALGHHLASVLVVVDQAEELMVGAPSAEVAALLAALLKGSSRPGGRVFLLLTLRSDFLGTFQNHPQLLGVPFANVPLGLMPVERFSRAIEGPAARSEIELEPGLVHSMMADARTDDALPLLAFALREIYERCRAQSRFTLDVYRNDLGGIQGAVARAVERIKAEVNWTPEANLALRRAFLALTRLNDEVRFTRQPARWADLPDQATPILEAFIKARLMTSDGDRVEVTHESLFRVWPELAGWLDQGRELMIWKKNIKGQLDDWIGHDHSSHYLLSGARVAEARRWLELGAGDFRTPELEFLTRSLAADDARATRDRNQQQTLRRLTRFLAAAALVASLTGIFALIQWNEAVTNEQAAKKSEAKERAERKIADGATKEAGAQRVIAAKGRLRAELQAKTARSQQLGLMSTLEPPKNLDRALLLAAEAHSFADTYEARDALLSALGARPGLRAFFHHDRETLTCFAVSPDGKTLAVGCDDRMTRFRHVASVVFWDLVSGRRLGDPLTVKTEMITKLAFSPDGRTLSAISFRSSEAPAATSNRDQGGVSSWDVASRTPKGPPLTFEGGRVKGMAFQDGGSTLTIGYPGDRGDCLASWKVETGEVLAGPVDLGRKDLVAVEFQPDRERLVVAFERGLVGARSPDLRSQEVLLTTDEGKITSITFRDDQEMMGIVHHGEKEDRVSLWQVAGWTRVGEPLAIGDYAIDSIAFRPGNRSLAIGCRAKIVRDVFGRVQVWDYARGKLQYDLGTGRPKGERVVEEALVRGVQFAGGGRWLAAGYGYYGPEARGGVLIWDMESGSPLGRRLALEGPVGGVGYSPNGEILAVSAGNRVELRDVGGGELRGELSRPGEHEPAEHLMFSPDGGTLAADYFDRLVLWDLTTRALREIPLGNKGGPGNRIAFSPDGRIIAAVRNEATDRMNRPQRGELTLWDATSTRLITREPVVEGDVTCVAFSPDGRSLAVGYRDDRKSSGGVIRWMWDSSTLQPAGDRLDVKGWVTGVAFGPRGDTLAACCSTSGAQGGFVIWDLGGSAPRLDTQRVDRNLEIERFSGVLFADGGRVMAGLYEGRGGGVILWDMARRSAVGKSLDLPETQVTAFAVAPDGQTLAACYRFFAENWSHGLAFWDVNPASWARKAREIANRNLSWEEWRRCIGPDVPYHRTIPDLPDGEGVDEAIAAGQAAREGPAVTGSIRHSSP